MASDPKQPETQVFLDLSIQVPSQLEVDDFVMCQGWSALIPDPNNLGLFIPNPVSQLQFARTTIIAFVRSSIKSKRVNEATTTVAQTKSREVEDLIIR